MAQEIKGRENGPYLIEGTAVYTDDDCFVPLWAVGQQAVL